MTAIKIVAETKDTVTVSRADLANLLAALDDAEDRAAIRSRRAQEAAMGKQAIRRNYVTGDEARRLLDGESPVRVWRDKRGLTQRALAATAGMAASYLADIENGRKPGSADALSRLASALGVSMEDLMNEQQHKRMPDYGPVYLRSYPFSIGIAPGHRGAAPQERKFASVGEAKRAVRDEWQTLKNQSPAIVDEQRLPILGQEDLWQEIEPDLFSQQPTAPVPEVMFEHEAKWSSSLSSYVMWATVGDEPLRCRVTDDVFRECLDEHGISLKDFPRLFRRHRHTFERAFLRAIRDRRFSPWRDSGKLRQEVILTSRDFHLLASSSV
jgi:transcriptional regulator with XRE-family HTH domain